MLKPALVIPSYLDEELVVGIQNIFWRHHWLWTIGSISFSALLPNKSCEQVWTWSLCITILPSIQLESWKMLYADLVGCYWTGFHTVVPNRKEAGLFQKHGVEDINTEDKTSIQERWSFSFSLSTSTDMTADLGQQKAMARPWKCTQILSTWGIVKKEDEDRNSNSSLFLRELQHVLYPQSEWGGRESGKAPWVAGET
jgi:hypothetical protein